MVAHVSQQVFLSNSENKAAFIDLVTATCRANGLKVSQAEGDADTLLVSEALAVARKGDAVSVVADDTDILVMLVYHWNPQLSDVYLRRESRGQFTGHIVSIQSVVKTVGSNLVSRLLVIHALSGCDTTSSVFGHGKTEAMKKLTGSELDSFFAVMSNPLSGAAEVGEAGCKLLVALCGGRVGVDSLDRMRHLTYMKLCSTRKSAVLIA
jgi:hypothetical protein